MCGIAGFCNFKGDKAKMIEKMKEKMYHRGPDAGGNYFSEDGQVTFGHRRLSIVDLSENGSQPMTSHSGRYVMTYNGEIYNYKKIAEKLLRERKVEAFRGTSDTEVLLEAFEAYGVKEAISLCKGMFAIALYDQKEQVLYLLRDRIGEKPLYYGQVGESFAFASDIGSLAVMEGFDNPINTAVLDLYFIHGYIPAPYSVYEGIYKLEAGTILKIKLPFNGLKSAEVEAYWSIKETAKKGQENLFKGSAEEAADELERLLKEAISEQMVADVPVGAFLSAGIDSSTVVALMQSLHKGKVKSFTIGMEEKDYNEAVYAKEIARHLGTDHTELYITEEDAKAVIPKLADMFGEPFADSSQIPTYLVSKMTRDHVTVSLSGDGGDELFCGYTSYASVERIWNKMKNIPYFIRKPCSELIIHSPLAKKPIYRIKGKLLGAKGPSDLYISSYETDPLTKQISLDDRTCSYKYSAYDPKYLKETNHNIMLMDMLMYHPDDILVKVDRAAMAVSLETRVPMLDKDVVEFAWTLPIDYEREGQTGKKVLRDVLYRYVPKEMMERPKKGFSIPIEKWLRQSELREWAESLIDRKTLEQQGILNPDVVWKIWKDFIDRGEWRIQIWYILMFQEWMHSRRIGL
ncbi:MAG: asparagine synthase (glutamine-hydrolyzing) [Lachnospiraceae bacterium]|nr:asparagine synthase (glutamine-hydrolyzing) [Lachnospiraceae bacterium]GFI04878.1 asparagine synthetase [glutamine-hydrolyzing] 1 [Lachnospiraceae bacterium]